MTQEIEQQNEEIITLLGKKPEGLSRGQVSESLSFTINDKTLQRRLTALVDEGRIVVQGKPEEVFSDVEKIESLGLDVPHVTRLLYNLKKEGLVDRINIIDIDGAVEKLRSLIG